MSEAFDPYHRWLGIPPKDQPPHHYRLLGIDLFENDSEVIRDAAERQAAHVRTYQLGPHSAESQKILGEIAAAQGCLLNREKKAAYDARLNMQMGRAAPAEPPPQRPRSQKPSTLPPPLVPVRADAVVVARRTTHKVQKNNPARYIGAGTAIVLVALLIAGYMLASRDNKPAETIAESGKSAAQGVESPAGSEAGSPAASQDGSRGESSPLGPVDAPREASPNGSETKPDTAEDNHSTLPLPLGKPESKPAGSEMNKTDQGSAQAESTGPRSQTSAQDDTQSITGPTNGSTSTDDKPNRTSPIARKNKPIVEHKLASMPREFDLSLPSGNVLSSKLFDVALKLEEDVLQASRNGLAKLKKSGYDVNCKDPYFDQSQQRFMYCDSVSGSEYMILGECKTGRLEGDLMAYYNEQPPTPHVYAHYKRGNCDGIVRIWDRNGANVYWCQYRNNSRQGFCGYFDDGDLKIVCEFAPGKSPRVYLCGTGGEIATFNSVDEAKSNKDAKAFVGNLDKIENEFNGIEKNARTAAHIPISVQTHSSRLKIQGNMSQREELKGVMERIMKTARSNGME